MSFVAWVIWLTHLIWFFFGAAVTALMVYGVFDGVALNAPVMASIVAVGATLLSAISFTASRSARRDRSSERRRSAGH